MDPKDEYGSNETFSQYSFRMACESRLRKESIAKALIEEKREIEKRKKERYRKARESQRQLSPELLELVGIAKDQLIEAAKVASAKAAEIEHRKQSRICICCCDDRDIKRNGLCEQCWKELTYGTIEPPAISERQIRSAACRVVRKGTLMS